MPARPSRYISRNHWRVYFALELVWRGVVGSKRLSKWIRWCFICTGLSLIILSDIEMIKLFTRMSRAQGVFQQKSTSTDDFEFTCESVQAVQCCQRRGQSPRPGLAIVERRPVPGAVADSPLINHLCMCASKCLTVSNPLIRWKEWLDAVQWFLHKTRKKRRRPPCVTPYNKL